MCVCVCVCVCDGDDDHDKDTVTFKNPMMPPIQTRLCILTWLPPRSLSLSLLLTSLMSLLPPSLAIWKLLSRLSFLTSDIPEGFPALTDFISTSVHTALYIIFRSRSPLILLNPLKMSDRS